MGRVVRVPALPCPAPLQPPFSLLTPAGLPCPVPGLFRWVSTTIARWDPADPRGWPTDLDCVLQWAQGYTGYDGAGRAGQGRLGDGGGL